MKTYAYYENNTEIEIIVGENKKENDELVRTQNKEYIWIHLENYPSPHVIVKKSILSSKVLYFASTICKKHSKYKKENCISIMYTNLKYVKPTNIIGTVNVDKYKTLKV